MLLPVICDPPPPPPNPNQKFCLINMYFMIDLFQNRSCCTKRHINLILIFDNFLETCPFWHVKGWKDIG